MKSKLTLVLAFIAVSLFGEQVPVEKAQQVAEHFLVQKASAHLKSTARIELTHVRFTTTPGFNGSIKKSAPVMDDLIHIFNINENEGFVIISGDDLATPVLGYSFGNGFEATNLPDNFRKWMEGYKSQIRYIRSQSGEASPETARQWEALVSGRTGDEAGSATAVDPLVTTTWDQSPYYNEYCPYDYQAGDLTVTGCAATAMAQIMKFWNYPQRGSGFHSYSHQLYGTLSANFGDATYDWGSMPNNVSGANAAVATLMYHCGISIDMNYGVASAGGSGAYVIIDHSPVQNCVEFALEEYFGYDTGLRGVFRENYSTGDSIELLKTELEAGRPIEYAGFGSGGGHAFVCDGFDPNDFFHFNWGWSGFYDGYFSIDALDPGGTGTGGGSGGYNSGHQALIGIKPPGDQVNYELSLYADVTISENPLFFTDPYTIHTDIANFGTTSFSGDFCAAIFDKDYVFIEFTEILEGATLGSEMHYTDGLDFANAGSVSMLPGDYYAGIFYRTPGGNWMVVGDGSYTNLLSFNVYYGSDIELYKDFVISTGTTITQNEAFTVTADILNDAETTFNGEFAVDLYDMNGEFAATVETLTGASLDPGYFYADVVFSSDGVDIAPGTYLLAMTHKPDGGDWILSGSSYHSNPIRVIVKEAPLFPTFTRTMTNSAHLLPLNFDGNNAGVVTEGSNHHIGTDVDFYLIELEEGYNYAVTARVHDSYNSGNGVTYTNDVLWAYFANEAWSDTYDDVTPGGFAVSNGGFVLFGVAPYFEGETGTYLLDIQVTRTGAVSTGLPEESSLKIYPNPASSMLHVEGTDVIERIELYDTQGRMMLQWEEGSRNAELNISDLNEGTYFLHIQGQNGTTVHKIVKQ